MEVTEIKCPQCGTIIYRDDEICIKCLIQESRDLIKKIDKKIPESPEE